VNLNEIRSKIREIVDLDQQDVSDTLLTMYIKDGYERIIALERRWPFFQKTYTLNTTSGQRAYPINLIGDGDLREVTSLVDTSAVGRWIGSFDQAQRPLYFSLWQDNVHLWPKPDAVYPLIVRGYRKPSDWTSSNSIEVDADERLHQALVYYGVAQVYQLQEDVELATFYRRTFDEAVRLATSDIMRPPSQRPLAFADGVPHMSSRWWLQSLGRTLGQ
jgi:hypothetical protein